jgi:hypothetical protein
MNQQQIDQMKAMLAQGQLWRDIVLHEYATILVAEVERLRAALGELAMHWESHEDMGTYCAHCDAEVLPGGTCHHNDACPYVAALKILEDQPS